MYDTVLLRHDGGSVTADVLIAIPNDTIRLRPQSTNHEFVPRPGMRLTLVAEDGEADVEVLEVAPDAPEREFVVRRVKR